MLWSAVEGQDWALHGQSKQGTEEQFNMAVEAIVDYIQI